MNKEDNTDSGTKVAVQRFNINSKKSSVLDVLNDKISAGFKELQDANVTFDLFWKDSDDECIRVHNNESLLDALKEMEGTVFSLYALMRKTSTKEEIYPDRNIELISG